jgi:hypothetical protein
MKLSAQMLFVLYFSLSMLAGCKTGNGLFSRSGNDGLLWQHFWKDPAENRVTDLLVSPEGDIVIAAELKQPDSKGVGRWRGILDVVAVRISPKGGIVWNTNMDGKRFEEVRSVVLGSDNRIILGGKSNSGDLEGLQGKSDGRVWKLNSSGEVEWERGYGGDQKNQITHILPFPDGKMLYTMFTHDPPANYSSDEFYQAVYSGYTVLHLADREGNIVRSDTFGGEEGDPLTMAAINQHGNVALCGIFESTFPGVPPLQKHNGGYAVLNDSFQVDTFGIVGGDGEDFLEAIIDLPNGNFLMVGGQQNMTSGKYVGRNLKTDGLLVEIDPKGNVVKTATLEGAGHVFFRDVHRVGDKVYVLGTTNKFLRWGLKGYGGYDHFVGKVDLKTLTVSSIRVYGTEQDDYAECFWVSKDGSVVIGGWIQEDMGAKTAWVGKFRR